MSSYVVSEADIALLTEALYRYEVPIPPMTPDALGRLLWDENHKSVNARYNENIPSPAYFHTGASLALVRNPLLVYKQVRHYNYQSCEHDGWETSEAARLMEALGTATLQASGRTEANYQQAPGYNDLPWGL